MPELRDGLVEALAELPRGAELVSGTYRLVEERHREELAALRAELEAARREKGRLLERACEKLAEAATARYERDEAVRRAEHATREWTREHARRLEVEARIADQAKPAPGARAIGVEDGSNVGGGDDRAPEGQGGR